MRQESALPPEGPRFRLGWILLTLIAGWAGSLGAVAAFGNGTYDISPFKVKLTAEPSGTGRTTLTVEPAPGLSPGEAEAETHQSYLSFGATIVGFSLATSAADILAERTRLAAEPTTMAEFLKESGRTAGRNFAIKVGLISLGGGLVGGMVISMGRWQRMVGGAIAGLVLIGALGAAAGLTYNIEQFRNEQFTPSSSAAP